MAIWNCWRYACHAWLIAGRCHVLFLPCELGYLCPEFPSNCALFNAHTIIHLEFRNGGSNVNMACPPAADGLGPWRSPLPPRPRAGSMVYTCIAQHIKHVWFC